MHTDMFVFIYIYMSICEHHFYLRCNGNINSKLKAYQLDSKNSLPSYILTSLANGSAFIHLTIPPLFLNTVAQFALVLIDR